MYMMKIILFKLPIQVKILKGDSVLSDSNCMWTSSLKAFSKKPLSDLSW